MKKCYETIFRLVFITALKEPQISEMIMQLLVLLAVLETEFFSMPSFTVESST
jgi:hypothetical protein